MTTFTQNYNALTPPAIPAGFTLSPSTNSGVVSTATKAKGGGVCITQETGNPSSILVVMLCNTEVDNTQPVVVKDSFSIDSDSASCSLIGRANAASNPTTLYQAELNVLVGPFGFRIVKFVGGTRSVVATQTGDTDAGGEGLGNFAADTYYDRYFTLSGSTLTLEVQRPSDSKWLAPGGTWQTTRVAVVSATDTSIPATGTSYTGLGWQKNSATGATKCVRSDDFSLTYTAPGGGTPPPRTTPAVFYVSNTGSNAADGLTTGTAWQTVAKINSQFAAGFFIPGDMIRLQRGGTWGESLLITQSGTTDAPIMFGSYGTGANPRIQSGVSYGARIKNASGIMIGGILFDGPGVDPLTGATTSGGGKASGNLPLSYTGIGIDIQSDTTGQVYDQGISLLGCEVRGYNAGILVRSLPAATGTAASRINNVSITSCLIHNILHTGVCTYGGNSANVSGAPFNFYNEFLHQTFYMADTEIWDVYGDPDATVWSGVAIQLNNLDGWLVERCYGHDSTSLLAKNSDVVSGVPNQYTSGGGGIFVCLSCRTGKFSKSKAANCTTVLRYDACGFDIDGGCDNCGIEDCVATNCDGPTLMSGNYPGSNSTVGSYARGNVGINNCRNPKLRPEGIPQSEIFCFGGNTVFYGNTFIQSDSTAPIMPTGITSSVGTTVQARVFNNVFYGNGSTTFAYLTEAWSTGHINANRYYSASNTPKWRAAGTNYTSIASWQGVGFDAQGSYGDPKFKNPTFAPTLTLSTDISTIDAFDSLAEGGLATAGVSLQPLEGLGFSSVAFTDLRGNARSSTSTQAGASATLYTVGGSVTGVTLAPTAKTMYPGGGYRFVATVAGTGTISQDVDWAEVGTTPLVLYPQADESVLVHVPEGTSPGAYQVRATSVQDGTKTATATITVIAVPAGGGDGSFTEDDRLLLHISAAYARGEINRVGAVDTYKDVITGEPLFKNTFTSSNTRVGEDL